jgi:hypothetical protein
MFACGVKNLTPKEFWDSQPKDIILMNEGFQNERKYTEGLHLETLRLLRYSAYTTYVGIPTKKGFRKTKVTKFYPLPNDPKVQTMSTVERLNIENRKEPLITNGKMRGYKDNDSNALYSDSIGGEIIAYINNDVIELVN